MKVFNLWELTVCLYELPHDLNTQTLNTMIAYCEIETEKTVDSCIKKQY